MFKITAITLDSAKKLFALYPAVIQSLDALLDDATISPSPPPWIQLSYDEISDEDLERLLGYAGITSANQSLGLPVETLSVTLSEKPVVVYSVSGLANHLQSVEPQIVAAYRQAGDMDTFSRIRGEQMTAKEYLIGGILDCISYCMRTRSVLSVRW